MLRRARPGPALAAILCWGVFLAAALVPASATAQLRIVGPPTTVADVDTALRHGVELESMRRWGDALAYYEDVLRESPDDARLLQRVDLAKIHYDLGRRYHDVSFRRDLLPMGRNEALDAYAEVLLKIDSHYVADVDWRRLVDRGTRSLEIALGEPCFVESQLAGASEERIAGFRAHLADAMRRQPVRGRQDAPVAAAAAAELARRELGIAPAAVVLEYLGGAVGGLDPYSAFLTSDQLRDVYSQIDGNFVGLGIELKADQGSLLIVSVIAGSPAAQAGIRANDRILSVGPRSTRGVTTDEAAVLLQGQENSLVDLVVVTGSGAPRALRVRRQHVDVPSVDGVRMIDPAAGVAYLKLASFQRNTGRDLDTALWQLHRQGMRSLVIDLRGNPGGLLNVSVEVADKFLLQGTIVSTRGRNRQEDYDYAARQPATWPVPLVVLIDSQSASASEIFAAAIRDNHRGTIVGKRSYGKGSVQGIFPLGSAGTGLRLTTAKFYSPSGRPISSVGVTPDIVVQAVARPVTDGTAPAAAADEVLSAGVRAARGNLAQR